MKFLIKSFGNYSFQIFLLRLILGTVMFAHGSQKIMGWFGGRGLEATIATWGDKLAIPPMLGYLAIFAEFFGGFFLIIGLLTRFSAIGTAITMAVAVFAVHWSGGFFMPKGIEFALTLLIISIVMFLSGPGKYSLDEKFFNIKSE